MPKQSYQFEDFRPLKRGEAGYSRTRRSYVSETTGEIISVSEFQKRARGGQSYTQYKEERQKKGIATKQYSKRIDKTGLFNEYYMHEVNVARENNMRPPTVDEALKSESWALLPTYLRSKSRSPKGRKAQALVWLGRRQPGWSFMVGETPD